MIHYRQVVSVVVLAGLRITQTHPNVRTVFKVISLEGTHCDHNIMDIRTSKALRRAITIMIGIDIIGELGGYEYDEEMRF